MVFFRLPVGEVSATVKVAVKLLILEELVENGKAEVEDTGILVPHEDRCPLFN